MGFGETVSKAACKERLNRRRNRTNACEKEIDEKRFKP
jgi:hypothetical protein